MGGDGLSEFTMIMVVVFAPMMWALAYLVYRVARFEVLK